MSEEKRGPGRPSIYSEELADRILYRLSGGESLRAICEDDSMPGRNTVLRWQHEHEDFGAKCTHARAILAEAKHEFMDDIEARVLLGELDPKAANVVLSNMRWRLEKMAPKFFGARLAVDHGVQDNLAERLRMARERASED